MNCPTLKTFSRFIVIFILVLHVPGRGEDFQRDFLVAGTATGISVGFEFFLKDRLLPKAPRFTTPNLLDQSLRSRLHWRENDQHKAEMYSDILIYGVSMSSVLWGPAVAKQRETALLCNLRVFATNSLLTNLIKITAGRQRPYSYFKSRHSEGPKDYASFLSGHSSVAFSQAVTNAMILSHDYPEYDELIWATMMGTAAATAYFRVAGDMHYVTDVLAGSALGSAVAWVITRAYLSAHPESEINPGLFRISLKIPLG